MVFIQLQTDLLEDERWATLSFPARWAYIHCCLVAKEHFETDGFITERQIFRADPEAGMDGYQDQLVELCDAGLIEAVPGGYQVVGWLNWNLSGAQIEEKSEQRRKAGRKGGIESGASRRSKTEARSSTGTKQNEAIVHSTEPIGDSDSPEPTAHSSGLTAHRAQEGPSGSARPGGERPRQEVRISISHGEQVTAETIDAVMDHPDYLAGHFSLTPTDDSKWTLVDRRVSQSIGSARAGTADTLHALDL